MKLTLCSCEQAVLVAVRTQEWTEALRAHFSTCSFCQEAVQVAASMESLAGEPNVFRLLPDASLIWLKAQLAQRRASVAKALKPVETFRRIAWVVYGVAFIFGLLMEWSRLERAVVWLNARLASDVSKSGVAGLLSILAILTLGAFSLYTMFNWDEHRSNTHVRK